MDTFILILELAGTAVVLSIRFLSAHFRWNLPRAHD